MKKKAQVKAGTCVDRTRQTPLKIVCRSKPAEAVREGLQAEFIGFWRGVRSSWSRVSFMD